MTLVEEMPKAAGGEVARGDGPWELPEGWVWAELGRLGAWTGGGTPSKSNDGFWTDGTIPWVSPKDMKVDVIGETEDKITEAALAGSATKLVPSKSVLMVMRSGILKHTFPVAVSDRPVTLNQDMRALTPHLGVEPAYLARFLVSANRTVLTECSKDGTTVNSIEARSLERMKVPIAPLAEQRRIVARIDELFAAIAEGEAALREARKGLDLFRRALLKAAVTGELTKDWRDTNRRAEARQELLAHDCATRQIRTPTKARSRPSGSIPVDVTRLPHVPDGWVWVSVRDVAAVIGGLTKNPNREKMPLRAPYLRVANVQMGRLDLTEIKEIGIAAEDRQRASLMPGDLLIVEGNGSIDQIGRCAIWNNEIAGCVHQNHIIKVRFPEHWMSRWCFTWLLSPSGRSEIERLASSTSGLHTLSISKVEAIPVPVPSPAEATEILRRVSDALSAVSDTAALLDAETADAARLRQSILKAAFEGRLVPQIVVDEPASSLLRSLVETPSDPIIRKRGRQRKAN